MPRDAQRDVAVGWFGERPKPMAQLREIRRHHKTKAIVFGGMANMFGLLALASVSLAPCPVERAQYVLRQDPDVTAYFRKVESGENWPAGLALAVRHKKSGETFWWLPWNGGTDGLQHMASTEAVTAKGWRPPNPDGGPRPFGDRQYIGMDAAYNVIDGVPSANAAAPAHMLFPDSAGARDTVFPTKQFFDLVGCSDKAD